MPPAPPPVDPDRPRLLQARGERTRRRLLDAGLTVFDTRGFHSTRVDDIVRQAETSHGTFYLYFSNKEDLFAALAGDAAEHLGDLAAELPALGPGDHQRLELRGWLRRFADLYEQYGTILRTWTEAEADAAALGGLGNDLYAPLGQALARRVAEVDGGGVDPLLASVAMLALIDRVNYFVLSGQVATGRDQMVETLASLVVDAVHAPDLPGGSHPPGRT